MTRKQTVGENLLYVMVWAAIILVPVLNSQMMSELHISFENVLIAWRQIAPYFIIFIIHNSVLAPRLMLRRKYKTYLLCDLALIIAVFWLVDVYEEHLTDHFLPHGDPEAFDAYRKASFSNLEMYWNVVLGFFMTGANTGIKLIYQSMRDEQQMEELKRQNLEAEMDYLKYQINPHFFMNTLNNIHALVDIDTEKAKQTIVELSRLMRYVLYESNNRLISLSKELQFLNHYIELMRIRYTDKVRIDVSFPTDTGEVQVPPLLFVSFVENAFKHGVSYQHASFVSVCLQVVGEEIHFVCSNSNYYRSEDQHHGIGLDNIRKRLRLLFGERYKLSIDDTADCFDVQLLVPVS